MLIQRLASAAVGIPLILLTIWVGDALLAAVVALAVAIAVIEIANARGKTTAPMALACAAVAASLPFAALAGLDWLLGATVLAIMLPLALLTLSRDPAADVDLWLWAGLSA